MINRLPKILVVDDEKDVCKLIEARLSKRGYQVIATKTADEFKRCAFSEKPDLLMMDILLGSDGIGTAIYDEILEAGFDPEVPVIFISALVDDMEKPLRRIANREKMMLYGKPFDFNLLCKDIDRMLDSNQNKNGNGHLKRSE